jgi:hypothetical protein
MHRQRMRFSRNSRPHLFFQFSGRKRFRQSPLVAQPRWQRPITIATGENKRYATRQQMLGHRVNFAIPDGNIKDGNIEFALLAI